MLVGTITKLDKCTRSYSSIALVRLGYRSLGNNNELVLENLIIS